MRTKTVSKSSTPSQKPLGKNAFAKAPVPPTSIDPASQPEQQPTIESVPGPEKLTQWMAGLTKLIEDLDAKVTQLLQGATAKDWYSLDEVAKIVGKAAFTVREWSRQQRINAEKKGSGRGKYKSWVVSHVELQRIQKEGLLPIR